MNGTTVTHGKSKFTWCVRLAEKSKAPLFYALLRTRATCTSRLSRLLWTGNFERLNTFQARDFSSAWPPLEINLVFPVRGFWKVSTHEALLRILRENFPRPVRVVLGYTWFLRLAFFVESSLWHLTLIFLSKSVGKLFFYRVPIFFQSSVDGRCQRDPKDSRCALIIPTLKKSWCYFGNSDSCRKHLFTAHPKTDFVVAWFLFPQWEMLFGTGR